MDETKDDMVDRPAEDVWYFRVARNGKQRVCQAVSVEPSTVIVYDLEDDERYRVVIERFKWKPLSAHDLEVYGCV